LTVGINLSEILTWGLVGASKEWTDAQVSGYQRNFCFIST